MFILYFGLWIIFNGTWTSEIAIIGLIVALAIFMFTCKFMDYSLDKELKFYRSLFLLIKYAVILVIEIVKANVAAVKMILSEREICEPVLAHFEVKFKTQTAKTLLANTITLTPGTITVHNEGDHFCVHCLDKSFARGMDTSTFVEIIHKLEAIWVKG